MAASLAADRRSWYSVPPLPRTPSSSVPGEVPVTSASIAAQLPCPRCWACLLPCELPQALSLQRVSARGAHHRSRRLNRLSRQRRGTVHERVHRPSLLQTEHCTASSIFIPVDFHPQLPSCPWTHGVMRIWQQSTYASQSQCDHCTSSDLWPHGCAVLIPISMADCWQTVLGIMPARPPHTLSLSLHHEIAVVQNLPLEHP